MRLQVTLNLDVDEVRALVLADDGVTLETLPDDIAGRLADAATELGADRNTYTVRLTGPGASSLRDSIRECLGVLDPDDPFRRQLEAVLDDASLV